MPRLRPKSSTQADDLSDFFAGRDARCWEKLGAWPQRQGDRDGWRFAVWAPAAESVAVIGEWTQWQPVPLARAGEIWSGWVEGAQAGDLYKLQVVDVHGLVQDRADPFARWAELRPGTASRLTAPAGHRWADGKWLKGREKLQAQEQPLAIYELHLGSWRTWDGGPPNYRDVAGPLVDHVKSLGFTHVELMPICEHPYDPSWGYQVTGYFAPTSRFGTPDDFRYFVDTLHRAGIGVLMDWVPAHFPRDLHGLGRFDGTPLFEHPDPRRGEHPDWGTFIFDYGRPGVRSFLLATAQYWLSEYHIDGLRVDAVASMLYLDYSRGPGQWQPNVHGGNHNLEAIDLLRTLNAMIRADFPGVLCIAEESTAFPHVTGDHPDGLGFSYKWNMGWMHDSLRYMSLDPIYRRYNHEAITFSTTYAFAERFVLPLSHDEVVHGKGSLVRKMGGRWEDGLPQLRLLLGYQWLHPGKKLLFMGQEFGQDREWNQDRELDWPLTAEPAHRATMDWVAALNALYRSRTELQLDCARQGFAWVEGSDRDHGVLVWERTDGQRSLVVVLHFTPVDRRAHGVPMPRPGRYRLLLNSHQVRFGGHVDSAAMTEMLQTHARWPRPHLDLDIPPHGVLVLEPLPEDDHEPAAP